MKKRSEVVSFVREQLESDVPCERDKHDKSHYGYQELRVLLDFIYEGEPSTEDENLVRDSKYRKSIM